MVYAAVYKPTKKPVAIKMIDLDMFERNQIDELRVSGLYIDDKCCSIYSNRSYIAGNCIDGIIQTSQCTSSVWLICIWIQIVYRHSLSCWW